MPLSEDLRSSLDDAFDYNEATGSYESVNQIWRLLKEIPNDYYARYPKLRRTVTESILKIAKQIVDAHNNYLESSVATETILIGQDLSDYIMDAFLSEEFCDDEVLDEPVWDFLQAFSADVENSVYEQTLCDI
jgi:hypothetical protein